MNNYLGWVCYDCYAYEANGVDALTYIEDDTERTEREQEIQAGEILSAQIVRSDRHGNAVQKHFWSPGRFHGLRPRDCGSDHDNMYDHDGITKCETQDFGRSPCENCGSRLGGSRHAFTYC